MDETAIHPGRTTAWSLRRRLLVAPMLGIALFALGTWLAFEDYHNQESALEVQEARTRRELGLVGDLSSAMAGHHTALLSGLIAAGDSKDEGEFYDQTKPALDDMFEMERRLKNLPPDAFSEPLEQAGMRNDYAQYRARAVNAVVMTSLDLSRSGQFIALANTAFENLLRRLQHNSAAARARSEQAAQSINAVHERLRSTLLMFLGAGIVLTLMFAWWISTRFSRDVTALINAMSEIAAGRDAVQIHGVRRPDELGRLARAAEAFQQASAALRAEVAERTRAQAALQESEQRLRYLIDELPYAAFVAVEGRIVFANEEALALFHAADFEVFSAQARRLMAGRPGAARGAEREAVSAPIPGEAGSGVGLMVCLDEETFLGEWHQRPIAWEGGRADLINVWDVTERQRLEEQLRQSQKMESVGQLTGGVAHDFNNLLTVIQGNLELVSLSSSIGDDTRELVVDAMRAAERGADLTQKLLAYSRLQPLDPQAVDVRPLIARLMELLRRTLGERIEIEIVGDAGLWLCEVDPGQLENAITNLAINARDAMPEGGKLTIESANVRLDDEYAAAQPDLAPGRYVMIAVSDTGTGIPEAECDRVFEPFYSTKEQGRGTGLGLAMVYGFVKQSRGHVSVYSEVGRGTTFKLYLPRVTGVGAARSTTAGVASVVADLDLRVLVVEDDAELRSLVVRYLAGVGCETLQAGDAAQALAHVHADEHIDVLLTDVMLPGEMTGAALAERCRKLRGGLPVLYMSGYTENAIFHHGRLDPDVTLLQKPFRREELIRKLRQVMAGDQSPA